jgi:hypothetical protein
MPRHTTTLIILTNDAANSSGLTQRFVQSAIQHYTKDGYHLDNINNIPELGQIILTLSFDDPREEYPSSGLSATFDLRSGEVVKVG